MDCMNPIRMVLADDHAVVRAGLRNALANLAEIEIVGEVGDGRELQAANRSPPSSKLKLIIPK